MLKILHVGPSLLTFSTVQRPRSKHHIHLITCLPPMYSSTALLLLCCNGALFLACHGSNSGFLLRNRQLANKDMPPIMYGTAWKEENTTRLVKKALELGFEGIDTANQPLHYREDLVGAGIEEFLTGNSGMTRESIFLQTKYSPHQSMAGYKKEQIPYDMEASVTDQVRQSISKSLKNLRTTYIDSVVLHSPLNTLAETKEAWRALETLVDQGKINQIGISNIYQLDSLKEIYEWARIKPSVVQNHFRFQECFDVQTRQWCAEKNVKYQSFWTLTANTPVLATPPVQKISSKRGLTTAQVWFMWVMKEGIVPLIGATDSLHMKEDLALLQMKMTAQEHGEIADIIEDKTGCSTIRVD